jgi:hypothetical protein
MINRSTETDPDTRPCPDCGVILRPNAARGSDERLDNGPLQEATPYLRLSALADKANVYVLDVPQEDADGLAGAIAVGFDKNGELRGMIGLAEDLDEDLCSDVFAFGIAVFVGDTQRITSSTSGSLGIGRERLQPAKKGPGHLAWHMLRTCGRNTPSATFDLESI